MIRKILIANRGEIACRIIRTCRDMGIATVAVYSDADAQALHVEMADEAIHIGGNTPSESYLRIDAIISAAKQSGADAIHPGFGFLAENADFAQAIIDNDLIFIGPSPSAIQAMGDKKTAKQLLEGIPLVPGYMGDDQSDDAFITAAATIGFPIMVKATAGGGGKGMRQVNEADALLDALHAARREAKQAFGDDTLMLERVVSQPRHVEVQIIGDTHGHIIALGERECTIQRRHQKIVEEAPSTALDETLRQQMLDAAVSVGRQIGYTNAGTVEFLVDGAGQFYFMEMNTRLQVEHPVTEAIFGIDLVRWQILVAEGHPLPTLNPQPRGHAIEVRVYAEDPYNGFLPAIGAIHHWRAPQGARVDTGVRSGDVITTYYDPMIAKVIAWGETRAEAIRKLDYALGELQLLGLRNNIAFLRRVITHPDHLAGRLTTRFIDEHPELLVKEATVTASVLAAAALTKQLGKGHWRNNPNRPIQHRFVVEGSQHHILLTPLRQPMSYEIVVDNRTHRLIIHHQEANQIVLSVDGHRQTLTVACAEDQFWVHGPHGAVQLKWLSPLPTVGERALSEGSLRAPMPGQVIKIMVESGQEVEKGAVLLIIEAMKMEHRIQAPYRGVVETIRYKVGDSVAQDEVLLELKSSEANDANA